MMEDIRGQKVVSIGGLNSNVNHLYLSDYEPGGATALLNFESSLYGGYRRVSGYSFLNQDEPEVDASGAEGKILGIAIYKNDVIVTRKQQGSDTYEFYRNDGSTWTKYTTGATRSSLGVNRVRYATFNFNGTEKIIFVDGVNKAIIFDGTNWYELETSATGADINNAGGNQVIEDPEYVTVFKNHIFLAKGYLVVHSAPLSDFDWTAASGAGQLPTGYEVNQIKPFRDFLYVFGKTNIKYITVSDTTFVLIDVTTDIGCLAPDSVVEINGSLMFLSQDGFRPISGTDRVNDIELGSVSRKVQSFIRDLIQTKDLSQVVSVVVRGKSHFRTFFSEESVPRLETIGIIGCIRSQQEEWEWGRLKGFRASCATSKYIGSTEYIVHGDYDGVVYRQESGNSFAGDVVPAIYTTPFLDFGDAGVRKTFRKVTLFTRPEGNMTLSIGINYDWEDPFVLNPTPYAVENLGQGNFSYYGQATYGSSTYSQIKNPIFEQNIQGSGFSMSVTYSSNDDNAPYTIQGAIYDFDIDGRK